MDMTWLGWYALDWLNLLLRWLHVITGIAWIGASFYFVWLDNHIRPPEPGSELAQKGVAGALWAVHGGGFYHPQKYLLAPAELPKELHWFKWEAYTTWLSGCALLIVSYYWRADSMMIDPRVAALLPWQAIAIGIAAMISAWLVYDLLCRSPLAQQPLWLGLTVYVLLIASAGLLAQFLSGRAVYIHVGAMIGTIMAGNVLMVIIPGQKRMVAALMQRQRPDPAYGLRAKQRSVHNNYFTLPLLFIMISNHYAMTYQHQRHYLVLALIMAAGVCIRHFFNLRHKGEIRWSYPAAGVALLIICAAYLTPVPTTPVSAAALSAGSQSNGANSRIAEPQILTILQQRCVACHAAQPRQPGFSQAPAGVLLETSAQLQQYRDKIYQQVVQTQAMPLANLTQMTAAEREQIARWYQQTQPAFSTNSKSITP